jgi:hypothetical protein
VQLVSGCEIYSMTDISRIRKDDNIKKDVSSLFLQEHQYLQMLVAQVWQEADVSMRVEFQVFSGILTLTISFSSFLSSCDN